MVNVVQKLIETFGLEKKENEKKKKMNEQQLVGWSKAGKNNGI